MAIEYNEWLFQLIAAVISLGGVYVAYRLFYVRKVESYNPTPVQQFFLDGWKFDKLYDVVFVKPFVWIANYNKSDAVDESIDSTGRVFTWAGRIISKTQNGRINWYLTGIVIGLILTVSIIIFIK